MGWEVDHWFPQDSIPGLGRSPGEGNATHSSILAWRILWKCKWPPVTHFPPHPTPLGSQSWSELPAVLCWVAQWDPGFQPVSLLHSWGSAGKNTGVGCHSLLQGNDLYHPNKRQRLKAKPNSALYKKCALNIWMQRCWSKNIEKE